MPIYCWKCDCGHTVISMSRTAGTPDFVKCTADGGMLYRDFRAENPIMATDDGYRQTWTRYYDQGAGRWFTTQAEYKAWQKANTKYGVPPEPMSKQQVADAVAKSQRRPTDEELCPTTKAQHDAAWMKCYNEVRKERMKTDRIVIGQSAQRAPASSTRRPARSARTRRTG